MSTTILGNRDGIDRSSRAMRRWARELLDHYASRLRLVVKRRGRVHPCIDGGFRSRLSRKPATAESWITHVAATVDLVRARAVQRQLDLSWRRLASVERTTAACTVKSAVAGPGAAWNSVNLQQGLI